MDRFVDSTAVQAGGLLGMRPVTIAGLAVPICGAPCMGWNRTTGTVVGLLVGVTAFVVTGRSCRND